MSASDFLRLERKDAHGISFLLTLEASRLKEEAFLVEISLSAGYSHGTAALHADEARILARKLIDMADRCDAVNDTLARRK